jgi:serine/threonine-protein kinase RIO1
MMAPADPEEGQQARQDRNTSTSTGAEM